MTDDLRERAIALADGWKYDARSAEELALAVAAMVAEECAQACEKIGRAQAQLEDRTSYVADDCAAAIRALEP